MKIKRVSRTRAKKRTIRWAFRPSNFTQQEAKIALGSIHVIPRKGSGWRVKEMVGRPSSKAFGTKDGAVRYAKEIANHGYEAIIIHDRQGRIAEHLSVRDPYPPK